MAAPKETVWRREDHTEGKHLVLGHYLEAWFPILGMGDRNGRILFIDGFAGPGEYEGGEEGSPVVAMRVLAKHSARELINSVEVDHQTRRRRYTYPNGCRINFRPQALSLFDAEG